MRFSRRALVYPALLLRGAGVRFAAVFSALVVLWVSGPVAAEKGLPFGQGLLWKVEVPAGDTEPSYVFGSIHATDPRVLNLPAEVRDAFGSARAAIFEIRETSEATARMSKAMLFERGESLSDHLNAEQLRLVGEAAERYGMTEHVLHRLKPWALFILFNYPPSERKRIGSGGKALDFSLQTRARDFGIPVYALETIDEQLALFDRMPYEEQVEYLDVLLRNLDRAEAEFERLIQLYLERNLTGLQAMTVEEMGRSNPGVQASFQENFLDRRNFLMAERMDERLQEGGAFVTIGALHLPGEKGVLNLLRSNGYRLTRVY